MEGESMMGEEKRQSDNSVCREFRRTAEHILNHQFFDPIEFDLFRLEI
jgi:hypothetical protein